MDFSLDDGQIELRETVARFCADHFALDDLAAREGTAVARSTWTALAGLGVFGLLTPEDDGGVGLGALEAAIVYEQLGSHLAPGPVVWTLLAAPLVAGTVDGVVIVAGVEGSAVADGEALVAHAVDADVVLVLGDDSVASYRVDALEVDALDALDPLGTVARVRGLVGGDPVGGVDAAERMRPLGALLGAAMLAGVGARALDVAREYALGREQFGVPIGSFQAVKHLLADMYVRATAAQSAVYAAGAALDDPGAADPRRATSVAKLLAADAALENAAAAVQVLGGMGFTWDMPPNHLLKRAWTLEHEFGSMRDHEAALGALIPSPTR